MQRLPRAVRMTYDQVNGSSAEVESAVWLLENSSQQVILARGWARGMIIHRYLLIIHGQVLDINNSVMLFSGGGGGFVMSCAPSFHPPHAPPHDKVHGGE